MTPQTVVMTKRTEGLFKGHDNAELFFQTWTVDQPRATLVVTHGLSEHSESYGHFADAMTAAGYSVIAWDMRGHGRSEGRRGYVDNFKSFSNDLEFFIRHLRAGNRIVGPLVLVGHSMGGLTTLRCIMDHGVLGAAAVCLSSPLLGVAVEVPAIKDFAARALFHVLPMITMGNEIDFNILTHDQTIISEIQRDPLRHDRVSPPLYIGMLENCEAVRAGLKDIPVPVSMQIAGDDKVVSRKASEMFFEMLKAPKKKLVVYEGFYHEIFNEVGREKVYSDLDAFLKEVL